MKYTSNIKTIIDLRDCALTTMLYNDKNETTTKINHRIEEINCENWKKAKAKIDNRIEEIKKEKYEDCDDGYFYRDFYMSLKIQALETTKSNLDDLIGYEVVEIEIDGYKCITKRISNKNDREISEKVYPFDERKKYPMQEIQTVYTFKRYYESMNEQ